MSAHITIRYDTILGWDILAEEGIFSVASCVCVCVYVHLSIRSKGWTIGPAGLRVKVESGWDIFNIFIESGLCSNI